MTINVTNKRHKMALTTGPVSTWSKSPAIQSSGNRRNWYH